MRCAKNIAAKTTRSPILLMTSCQGAKSGCLAQAKPIVAKRIANDRSLPKKRSTLFQQSINRGIRYMASLSIDTVPERCRKEGHSASRKAARFLRYARNASAASSSFIGKYFTYSFGTTCQNRSNVRGQSSNKVAA